MHRLFASFTALFLLTATLLGCAHAPTGPQPFLSPEQTEAFYRQIVHELERLDAEGIAVRNESKGMSWEDLKTRLEPRFLAARSWDDLEAAFDALRKGWVNLHSRFRFENPAQTDKATFRIDRRLGAAYPDISFFDRETGETVTAVNGIPLTERFQQFSDQECPFNHDAACVDVFVSDLQRARLLFDGRPIASWTAIGEDGPREVALQLNPTVRTQGPPGPADCPAYAESREGFDLAAAGRNVCLLRRGSTALVRIETFHYPGDQGGGIHCEEDPAPEDSLCADVNILLDALHSGAPVEGLLFDVQGNGGGVENSPLLAAFMPKPFLDLLVSYRKLPELEDPDLRTSTFWNSSRAEAWYQKLVAEGTFAATPYGGFLPPRADFCRGSELCLPEPIAPNPRAFVAERLAIVTDGFCVSSCDDFVWRMHDYAGAQVAGLPHAADATYSRLTAAFYLDRAGQVRSRIYGERPQIELGRRERLLATIKIPISRTVSPDGEMITGRSVPLDLLIPVTRETYDQRDAVAVERAYQELLLSPTASAD